MAGRLPTSAYAKMIAVIVRQPVTAWSLSHRAKVSTQTAYAWLKMLRKENLIHRVGWVKRSHAKNAGALWEWGEGKDVPYPVKSAAQRMREFRQRRKTLAGVWKMPAAQPIKEEEEQCEQSSVAAETSA